MILWLVDFLQGAFDFKIPAVFYYYSTRMVLAALTALLVSIFFGSRFIGMLYRLKVGQPIRTADYGLISQLHANKKDTPTMGGLLILSSMLLCMLLWMDWGHVFTWILLLTTLVLGAVGGVDDYLKMRRKHHSGLSGRMKLLVQLALAAAVAAYLYFPVVTETVAQVTGLQPPVVREAVLGKNLEPQQRAISLQDYAGRLYAPFLKGSLLEFKGALLPLGVFFILFVVVGSSNAVNLTDGLDGLAAGCLLMVASCLALFAFVSNHSEIARYLNILYVEGAGEIGIYLCAFAGACLGFLWYNGYPAQVFMGDIGSLTLGGVLGVSTVLLKRELLLALIGGIFVVETLSVIIQVGSYRYRNKRRVFLCTPLHHHFEYLGWPEAKVVVRFWIIGLILALLGIASLKFQ